MRVEMKQAMPGEAKGNENGGPFRAFEETMNLSVR